MLPEESLKAFEGENPFGLWKLEILDNRTGANINVTLLDWQLHLFRDNNAAAWVVAAGRDTDKYHPGRGSNITSWMCRRGPSLPPTT